MVYCYLEKEAKTKKDNVKRENRYVSRWLLTTIIILGFRYNTFFSLYFIFLLLITYTYTYFTNACHSFQPWNLNYHFFYSNYAKTLSSYVPPITYIIFFPHLPLTIVLICIMKPRLGLFDTSRVPTYYIKM